MVAAKTTDVTIVCLSRIELILIIDSLNHISVSLYANFYIEITPTLIMKILVFG